MQQNEYCNYTGEYKILNFKGGNQHCIATLYHRSPIHSWLHSKGPLCEPIMPIKYWHNWAICNWAVLDLIRSGGLRGPIMHQLIKFQQNRAMQGMSSFCLSDMLSRQSTQLYSADMFSRALAKIKFIMLRHQLL